MPVLVDLPHHEPIRNSKLAHCQLQSISRNNLYVIDFISLLMRIYEASNKFTDIFLLFFFLPSSFPIVIHHLKLRGHYSYLGIQGYRTQALASAPPDWSSSRRMYSRPKKTLVIKIYSSLESLMPPWIELFACLYKNRSTMHILYSGIKGHFKTLTSPQVQLKVRKCVSKNNQAVKLGYMTMFISVFYLHFTPRLQNWLILLSPRWDGLNRHQVPLLLLFCCSHIRSWSLYKRSF